MIFGNPIRQAYLRPPGAPRILGSFRVTQDFGPTSFAREPAVSWPGGEGIPAGYYPHFHRGMDIGDGSCGDDRLAMQAGTVIAAGVLVYTQGGVTYRPIRVIIDHGGGWSSEAWHLQDEIVSVGQKVTRGQVIGHIGTTGNSTACHDHVVVKLNGKHLDPWRRLAQNVSGTLKAPGINIRASAGSGTTLGPLFAATREDGGIYRTSDGLSLGPFSQALKWDWTVKGATYTLAGVTGNTWEKIFLDGAYRFVATPLVQLSAEK